MEKNIKGDQFNVPENMEAKPDVHPTFEGVGSDETNESTNSNSNKSENNLESLINHGRNPPNQNSRHPSPDPILRPQQVSRKRKLSIHRSRVRDSKKRRSEVREKSAKPLERKRKLLEKNQRHRGRASKRNEEVRISKTPTDKSKDNETSYKQEYNRQLDHLANYGKNFYCPALKKRTGLRPIYIDGSNVAFSHGQNERFSVEGLKICIDYFRKRGHEVKAFVPHFRLRRGESTDQKLLHELVTKKLVITTPTLYIQNQRRSPYDDWYIVQSAAANGGIIVSSDNFQDIIKWNPNLRSVIEECRLVPTFVDDMLIFPVDPHGNRQNNLEQFLKF